MVTPAAAAISLACAGFSLSSFPCSEGFIPKSRFDEVNEAKKTLEEDVKARDKQLEELKKSNEDNETLQGQIKKLQDSNKAEKERYESELKSLKIANAFSLSSFPCSVRLKVSFANGLLLGFPPFWGL